MFPNHQRRCIQAKVALTLERKWEDHGPAVVRQSVTTRKHIAKRVGPGIDLSGGPPRTQNTVATRVENAARNPGAPLCCCCKECEYKFPNENVALQEASCVHL